MLGHSLVENRRMIHLERKEENMVLVAEHTANDRHLVYIDPLKDNVAGIGSLLVELEARGSDLRCIVHRLPSYIGYHQRTARNILQSCKAGLHMTQNILVE